MTFIDNKFLKPIMFMERSRKMKLFNKFSKKQKKILIQKKVEIKNNNIYNILQQKNKMKRSNKQ